MPAKSAAQQKLFGWALACKRGEAKDCPANIEKLAASMSEEELEKFANTKHEDLPAKVEEALEALEEAALNILEQISADGIELYEAFKEIRQPKGDTIKNAKSDYQPEKTGKITGENMKESPNVDNDTDEKDLTPEVPPGILSAKKEEPTFTPSLFKLPMGKKKDEKRVYDFNQFLKIINYKTQDDILQKGHGQNLTGKNMRDGGGSTASLPPNT